MSAALILGYYDQEKDVAQIRRQELGSLYEELSSVMVGQTMAPRKLQKHIESFMRKAVVYASPEVLGRLREFRLLASAHGESEEINLPMMLAFEALVLAMRKDLAVSNRGISTGDLLRLNITDIDEYLPPADVTDSPGEHD